MFRGLINDAKSAVGEMATRYASRALIAILFLFALGFAVAAVTIQLVSIYGAISAFWMVAGAFAVVALIATLVEMSRENMVDAKTEEPARAEATGSATSSASEAAMQAALQLPLSLLTGLATSPVGPLSVLSMLRFLGRNMSLVVLAAFIAMLLWQTKTDDNAPAVAPDEAVT